MSVNWKPEWTALSDRLVGEGVFDNAEQAADAAFALLADYAAERASLKAMVDRAIADDQWVTPEDLDRDIESHFAKREAQGGRL